MDNNMNVLISADQIKSKIEIVGAQISEEYKGKNLYVMSLLRGSFIFCADLVRSISIPVKIGFMTTSSYGNNEESSGKVKLINDVPDNLEGFDVLIVDDIIDTGITMDFVKNHISSIGAKSVKCCVLLDKPDRRKISITPDYCCFQIPDVFVAGYGLNYGDFYRNIPFVFNFKNR